MQHEQGLDFYAEKPGDHVIILSCHLYSQVLRVHPQFLLLSQ